MTRRKIKRNRKILICKIPAHLHDVIAKETEKQQITITDYVIASLWSSLTRDELISEDVEFDD